MPPVTLSELVLAVAVIWCRRLWRAWRTVPTYRHGDDTPHPDPDQGVQR